MGTEKPTGVDDFLVPRSDRSLHVPSIRVRPLGESDRSAWTRFVDASAEATMFHRIEWKDLLEQVFRHRTHYLVAERSGSIAGLLPLAQVRSLLFGHSLSSLPFCVYGGAIADDAAVASALHDAARDLAIELGTDYLELRNRNPAQVDWPRQDLYATFRMPLIPDIDATLKAIPSKRRNMVRKAEKSGLRVEIGDSVERFFPLYADNVHRHGTPPLPKFYFEALTKALGNDHEILTVVNSTGRPIASAFLMYFRDEVSPYYVGDCPEARNLAANDFMYWHIIKHAITRGCRIFDWSRSKKGTGSFEFKKLWGFEPTPLHYEYALFKRDSIPQNNPLNPKYRAMITIWQRLPRPIVNALGPHIVRNLG
ncbi:MAG: FemAB family XrtA/PEP-CTERM system-associated protein [Burkholderiales bacterium]